MADQKILRVGVVGAGSWARSAYLPTLLDHPDTRVVAICDADPAVLDAVIAEHGGGWERYDNATAMLDREALDLVCIVTPDDQHALPIRAAVANGTHIICEKPLALTGPEAWDLTRLVEAAELVNRVGFTVRYAPSVNRVAYPGQCGSDR